MLPSNQLLDGSWQSNSEEKEPMNEMVAYCGLVCRTCPIYLATRQEDREEQARMRAKIAQLCKQNYGMNYEPGDITDCDGCRTEAGRLFSASKNCPIRNCAKQHGVENCAYCNDYACERLEAILATEPAARMRLDEIKRHIH